MFVLIYGSAFESGAPIMIFATACTIASGPDAGRCTINSDSPRPNSRAAASSSGALVARTTPELAVLTGRLTKIG